MSKLNPTIKVQSPALAGGCGLKSAVQSKEAQFKRLVMANLLFEDLTYIDGQSVADQIKELIPQVNPATVAQIAVEAREKQKLRHIPLFIIREMARYDDHKSYVGDLLAKVCNRADMVTDFLALYWADGKQTLSSQVRKGLAKAFHNFDEYQLGKYENKGSIKLRDALFLCRPKAKDEAQNELFQKLARKDGKSLKTPDTWEVSLSSGADKKETWERLILSRKLGASAFLKNLRNMEQAQVSRDVIKSGFETIKSQYLLPLDFYKACKYAPQWIREIETLMLRTYQNLPKLPGWTIFVVDVSGSMNQPVSSKSEFNRLDAACAMAVLASEVCERITIYATAGNDWSKVHSTKQIPNYRGFALGDEIKRDRLGNGGIFTRQCLEYVFTDQKARIPDRIMVFSDSQDCDQYTSKKPNPFGVKNYIIDVSAHQHGINYQGAWTAEISGWSEHFINYVAALEGVDLVSELN